uniref:Uncharacterized protein n=1 Tax=Rhizophora mucronata TaxID=61149 RepID=A0A2P2NA67_RHIMU
MKLTQRCQDERFRLIVPLHTALLGVD